MTTTTQEDGPATVTTLVRRLLRPRPGWLSGLGASVLALGLAAALVALQGYAPFPTLAAGLVEGLGGVPELARTLAWALPMYVAVLGVAVAFRAQMFNIGAEGQIYAGAMGAALAGAHVSPMARPLHLGLALAAAGGAGAIIAAGLGWMRARWDVDEVLSTLLSNYIIILFTTYLVTAPLRDPSRQSGTTRPVHDTAMFQELLARTGLTSAIVVVGVLVIAMWWASEHSTTGYRWRMTGQSDAFAAAVGINVARARVSSMAVSGALCGIAGGLLVTASQGRFWTGIGTGIGWDAVLLALISRARPGPAVLWVTLYALMRSTARGIEQVSDVPSELSLVMISVVIILAVARSGAMSLLRSLGARYPTTARN